MKKYILIWQVNSPIWENNGNHYLLFESEQGLIDEVNNLLKDKNNEILHCFKLENEVKFKPIMEVVKWEIE